MKEKEIIDWTISPEVQEDLLADKVAAAMKPFVTTVALQWVIKRPGIFAITTELKAM